MEGPGLQERITLSAAMWYIGHKRKESEAPLRRGQCG